MDAGLSSAALKKRFRGTAKRSRDALDQVESAALEECFPLELPSFTDAKYHKIRDDRGNRHLVLEEEMRDESYPGFQQRSRELFQIAQLILNEIVVQGHYDEWESELAMMANPENVFERVNLLLQIQARALETWRLSQDVRVLAPRNDESVKAYPEPLDLDNNSAERWEVTAELITRPSYARPSQQANAVSESISTLVYAQSTRNPPDEEYLPASHAISTAGPAPKVIIDLCSPEPESDSDSSPASQPANTKESDHSHRNETSIKTKRNLIDESSESKNPSEGERDSKRVRRV